MFQIYQMKRCSSELIESFSQENQQHLHPSDSCECRYNSNLILFGSQVLTKSKQALDTVDFKM